MYEDFLPLVSKPARYIDSEVNVVRKDPSSVRTRICLLFPDTYEVGMSHIGLRILYHVLNTRADTYCERVFSPWLDYEQQLAASGRRLASLETDTPLANFDAIGVTLQYELSYTNVLAALRLAGLPLRSGDRSDDHPLIIAGGPCSVNPEPLSEFIDVFFIGEAEESMHELVATLQQGGGREAVLKELAKRDGFYVPALGKTRVHRRFLKSIESAAVPDKPLLPLMKPVHDRITAEIARGCIRGCRFCQAGIIYRPYRERSPETIKRILHDALSCTGYEELSLASLSAGDYSGVEPLVVDLMERYRDERVSVSLPSLRVGTLTPVMIKAIAGARKTGFTLAPEAGTERLRRVINKPISDLDLLDAAETIFRNGWSTLKLYFMIGLPTETQDDLDGIVRLVPDILAAGKQATKRHVQINVTVSTFVPKPHTPFQWFGQASLDEIRQKQAYLAGKLKRRSISLKPHNPEMSLLEGVFARGDASLGRVLEAAMERGCRMDGWSECFDFQKWDDAFSDCNLDPTAIAGRSIDPSAELPWDHVRTGVTKEFLKKEYQRALAAEITDNCRVVCEHCGIGCKDGGSAELGKPAAGEVATVPPSRRQVVQEPTTRLRMRYEKTGRLRFLSHLDFMTLMHRAIARAGIAVAFSQGFNPHPRISFGPALSVGMESADEYLDMDVDPFTDLSGAVKALNESLPEGIRILGSRAVSRKAASLSGSIARYRYEVTVPGRSAQDVQAGIAALLAKQSIIVERDGKQKDIRPGIEAITLLDGEPARIELVLVDADQVRVRVLDVVEKLFGIDEERAALFSVKRTALYAKENGKWISPFEVV